MSNNDLYCKKCKSNHHPAVDCVMTFDERIHKVLRKFWEVDTYLDAKALSDIKTIIKESLPKEEKRFLPKKNSFHQAGWAHGRKDCLDETYKKLGLNGGGR